MGKCCDGRGGEGGEWEGDGREYCGDSMCRSSTGSGEKVFEVGVGWGVGGVWGRKYLVIKLGGVGRWVLEVRFKEGRECDSGLRISLPVFEMAT